MPTPRGKSQEASALPPKGRPSAYHQLSKLDDPLPPNLRKLADPGWYRVLHGRMCAAIALWRIEIACDRMERKLGRITEADGTRRPPRLPVAIIFFEKFAKRALLGVQLGISNKKQAFMYVRFYNREIGSFLKKWPRNSIAAATDEPNAATPPAENRQADVVHPPRRQNVAKKLCEVTGASYDECLVALEENDDDANDAAAALLTRESLLVANGNGGGAGSPVQSGAGSSHDSTAPALTPGEKLQEEVTIKLLQSTTSNMDKKLSSGQVGSRPHSAILAIVQSAGDDGILLDILSQIIQSELSLTSPITGGCLLRYLQHFSSAFRCAVAMVEQQWRVYAIDAAVPADLSRARSDASTSTATPRDNLQDASTSTATPEQVVSTLTATSGKKVQEASVIKLLQRSGKSTWSDSWCSGLQPHSTILAIVQSAGDQGILLPDLCKRIQQELALTETINFAYLYCYLEHFRSAFHCTPHECSWAEREAFDRSFTQRVYAKPQQPTAAEGMEPAEVAAMATEAAERAAAVEVAPAEEPPQEPESDEYNLHIEALTAMPYDAFMDWLKKGAGERPHPAVYLTVRTAPKKGIRLGMIKHLLDKVPTIATRGLSVQKLHLAFYVSHFTHVVPVFRQAGNPSRIYILEGAANSAEEPQQEVEVAPAEEEPPQPESDEHDLIPLTRDWKQGARGGRGGGSERAPRALDPAYFDWLATLNRPHPAVLAIVCSAGHQGIGMQELRTRLAADLGLMTTVKTNNLAHYMKHFSSAFRFDLDESDIPVRFYDIDAEEPQQELEVAAEEPTVSAPSAAEDDDDRTPDSWENDAAEPEPSEEPLILHEPLEVESVEEPLALPLEVPPPATEEPPEPPPPPEHTDLSAAIAALPSPERSAQQHRDLSAAIAALPPPESPPEYRALSAAAPAPAATTADEQATSIDNAISQYIASNAGGRGRGGRGGRGRGRLGAGRGFAPAAEPPTLPLPSKEEATPPQPLLEQGQTPARGPIAEDLECVVCAEGPRRHAYIPCGHLALCDECANSLHATAPTREARGAQLRCPACNGEASKVVRIYM